MRKFFGGVFTSCLGTILALVVLFFVVSIMAVVMNMGNTSSDNKTVLLINVNRSIPEKSGNVEQEGFGFSYNDALGLHDIKRLIKHAESDSKVHGIVYKTTGSAPSGLVTASEITASLQEFQEGSNKFFYSYGDNFDNSSYLVASSADSIFINPNGTLDINGYASMIPFLKGALDKLDIEMDVIYAGQYKSATEPLRRKNMSDQNRLQTRAFLEDNFSLYLNEVAHSRQVPKANFLEIINDLNFSNIEQAQTNGLIDGVNYWYEVEDLIREKLNIKAGRKVNYKTLEEYDNMVSKESNTSKNKIAVVFAEGEVQYNSPNRGNINEKTYHEVFDKIRKDKNTKAVVLRVNSPGGSAFTSDVIWKEMDELQSRGIPVVASFGDYAASGGYYIAAGADTIVCHPKSLTGSIGVFSVFPNFKKFMEDKVGITFDTVKTSPYAVAFSPFYEMGEEEKQAMQDLTDKLYNQFLGRVAKGRGKSIEEINEVAQGRVWTGQRALEKGLVDVLGNLEDAIEIAAEMAELESYRTTEYPKIEKEFWEELASEFGGLHMETKLSPQSNLAKVIMKNIDEMSHIMNPREPLARVPFILNHK